jgi:hypothetical protein
LVCTDGLLLDLRNPWPPDRRENPLKLYSRLSIGFQK